MMDETHHKVLPHILLLLLCLEPINAIGKTIICCSAAKLILLHRFLYRTHLPKGGSAE
jgi:hypothetical protein